MRLPMQKSKLLFNTCTSTLIIVTLTVTLGVSQILGDQTVTVATLKTTVQTDKQTYLLRQKVSMSGNLTFDNQPITNLVVNVQVTDPLGYALAYRTLQIGTPSQSWPINIVELALTDTGNDPLDTAKAGSQNLIAGLVAYNPQLTPREIYSTITVFDANMAPVAINAATLTIDPQQNRTNRFSFEIPKWACPGKAFIVGNVYSKEPRTGGQALAPEETLYYCLSRTQQGLLGNPPVPTPPPQNILGKYNTSITLSPDPRQGTYNVSAMGQASPTLIGYTSTTFNVQRSTGYPPQAVFVYQPSNSHLNETVNFDASFSTPEGFNGVITRYEWDFGDGTPKVVMTGSPPTGTTTHTYLQANKFIITLNATDNEVLWSATSKPITILPESPPTASFTWTPTTPYEIDNATFDASSSTPGWSAKEQSLSPIINYTWFFNDGSSNVTTTNQTTTHMFGREGYFTVYLTVTDDVGRSGVTSHAVHVLNSSSIKKYDVTGDGKVDVRDIYAGARAFGSVGSDYWYPGSPPSSNWNPLCDFNGDNKVDMRDYYPLCQHYGMDP
jgi:hypothetical protein